MAAEARSSDQIYDRPQDYDLEHEADDADVRFFQAFASGVRPRRVLELASGSGRVTLALAETGARAGLRQFTILGVELGDAMLAEAEAKRRAAPADVRAAVEFARGDMRAWRGDAPFDLVITPGASISHLLSLDDQLATWRTAFDNLAPGGRFVVDIDMPPLSAYADALRTPPRLLLEVDADSSDPETGDRLIRYKTTRYLQHEQRAEVRFLYDKFTRSGAVDRNVSDLDAHVYFPRELLLLFLFTGFEIERVYGDYQFHPLGPASPQIIVVGRKPFSGEPHAVSA